MHILIEGNRGVGKSTLIRRVLSEVGGKAGGFVTLKDLSKEDAEKGTPLYIYPYGAERVQTAENKIGYCKNGHASPDPAVFDRFAAAMKLPGDCEIIVMDELGFMERNAMGFQKMVMNLLDGDIPVIAAVKDKSTPFLDAVKAHPKCRRFFIDENNRDALFEEVLSALATEYAAEP